MSKFQLFTTIVSSTIISFLSHFMQAQNPGNVFFDHLTIVVNDLEQAKEDFEALGFTIKPGRLHTNSIENAHIKFPDGTALELITATEPKDALAENYIKKMVNGDGPAYLCLGMDVPETIEALLSAFNPMLTDGSYYKWITFPEQSVLSYFFFMKYTNPPVDKKEHLEHEIGVIGIKSISLEKDDFSNELSMFQTLDVDIAPSRDIITLDNHSLILELNDSHSGSALPVISITLFVENIHASLERLPKGLPFIITSANTVVLAAEYCHGITMILEQKP